MAAKNIGKRYAVNRPHVQNLEMTALAMFDATKKMHGMKERERLLLQMAVMLHDVGKYISFNNVADSSYNIIMSNATQVAGEVRIDDFAVIGGGTLVHQFCHVGAHVMIQGGSLINKDIPPYVKAARNPISYAGINSIGLRRRNFTNETIRDIQEIYRYLYLSGLNNSDAIERIEAELPATKERDEIVLFVRNSQRGIIRGYL